jgi:hypothetical protein
MNRKLLVTLTLVLAACTSQDSGVRVTAQAPVKPAPKAPAVPQTRTEPIFYNGKTYQLHFSHATSSLRYFACKDGSTGKLTTKPSYQNNIWRMTARCA